MKIKIITLLIMSIALTACTNTKQNKVTNTVMSTADVIVAGDKPDKAKEIPTVYEKRSPQRAADIIPKNNALAASFTNQLSSAALGRLRSNVKYDGSYVKIAYPGGDVSPHTGVCTDVVIRSYRKLGIDLQEQVHRDMSAAFNSYPNPSKWGLSKPDTNIDHRRVYNLRKFFQRRGAALPVTNNPKDYKPGDVVSWMVGPNLPHIGVVVNKPSKADPNRLMVVHNIARGPELQDMLFAFPITGHYRYTPANMGNIPNGIYTQNNSSHNQKSGQTIQLNNIDTPILRDKMSMLRSL